MSEPIKVGDLVQVVRCDHLHGEKYLGQVMHVTDLDTLVVCGECGDYCYEGTTAVFAPGRALPIPWLKRIPPLSELDDVQQDEELTA